MAVTVFTDVLESELWPQQDARDPLGIFGWRVALAGDATGGSAKCSVQIAEDRRHAYVWKIYDMVIAQIVGTPVVKTAKLRILTNWPNIDTQPGIQAYGAVWFPTLGAEPSFTVPNAGIESNRPLPLQSKDLLIYDPSTQTGDMGIAELEVDNTDGFTYVFEGYGYYYDRSVMSTPGGPRNPGTA